MEGVLLSKQSSLVGAVLVLLFAACPIAQAQAQAPAHAPDEDYVILWRRVPNNFYSPALDSEEIRQLVDRSPVKTLRLNSGDTISDQLQKQFLVNERWTPAIYKRMVSKIIDLNGLESSDAVKAGQELLVPVIPQTGRASRTRPEQSIGVILSETELDYTSIQVETSASASNAGTEIQYIKVRASELGRYVLDISVPQGAFAPVRITLGVDTDPALTTDNMFLEQSIAEQVRTGLSQSMGVSPVLLVVDDSIPDHAEYARTKDFMLEMSKIIRDKHGFGDSPFSNELKALKDRMPGAQEHLLYPNLATHASVIKKSLQPLSALDPRRRVRVIYLPLAATQMGVTPIYKELLYLAELLKITQPSLSLSVSPTALQRNMARTVTMEIVERNTDVFMYGPVPFSSSGNNTLTSDRALLEGLSIVLDAYSNITAQPHALSYSWTMPKLQFPTYIEPNALGWKFAAAGNHASDGSNSDFLLRGLQFASRAAGPKDVIAVLNSDGASGSCASNLFDDSMGIQVLGLSFSGSVDADFCGTSFSTPRVAWLFAAREAIYGQRLVAPVTTPMKVAWYERQQRIVLGQRIDDQAPVLKRYNLDVRKLFDQ